MPCPSPEALTHWADSLDRNPVALHAIECATCRATAAQHRQARALATTLPSGGEHLIPSDELFEAEERYASQGVELARGGLGRVVPATDRVLRRPVAVKELTVGADDRD